MTTPDVAEPAPNPRARWVRYGVGPGTAAIGWAVVALFGGPLEDPTVARLVDSVLRGSTIDDTINVLFQIGLRDLPDFALAFATGDQWRILVRGAAVARPHDLRLPEINAHGSTTWFEDVIPAGEVSLFLDAAATSVVANHVLIAGTAPAQLISLDATPAFAARSQDRDGGAPTAPPAAADAPAPSPAAAGAPHVAAPGATAGAPATLDRPAPTDGPAPADGPAVADGPTTGPSTVTTDDADRGAAPVAAADEVATATVIGATGPGRPDTSAAPGPTASPAPGAVPSPAPAPAIDDEFDFGHLLGETVYRGVEDAAIRPDDEPLEPPILPSPPIPPIPASPANPASAGVAPPTTQAPPINEETRVYVAPGDEREEHGRETPDTPDAPDAPAPVRPEPVQAAASPPPPPDAIAAEAPLTPPPPPVRPPGLISSVPGMTGARAEQGEQWRPTTEIVTTAAGASTAPPAAPAPRIGAPPIGMPPAGPSAALAGAPPPPPEPPKAAVAPKRAPVAPRRAPAPPVAGAPPSPVAPLGDADLDATARGAGDEGGAGEEGDHLTVSAAELHARRQAAAVPTGPTVQAVHCPLSHPNPPQADRCRWCGQPIPDRTVRSIPRPALGALHFDDGQVVTLTHPLVIGRKPPAGARIAGEDATVVLLPDPDGLLSRTHAEVHLVDWQVQVVDRDSMNHTFVDVPGLPKRQLRPAEPFPIPPGTVVDLGGAVTFEYRVVP